MAKFSEKDAETLFKRVKPPSTGSGQAKPKVAKAPRKRGQRGPKRVGSADDAPIDDGKGKMTRCSKCGWTWNDAARRYTRVEGGVEYDYWRCGCMVDGKRKGHEYTRYK